jgi:outer membrane protein TolC
MLSTPRALRPAALLLLTPLLAGSVPGVVPPPGPAPTAPPGLLDACLLGETPEPVSLSQVWERGRALEPGFQAARDLEAAGEAARTAAVRSWIPAFEAEGLWNHGQRTSPGEERVLGVGPRGDLRLLGSWTLVDGSRGHRLREAGAEVAAARAAGVAFDVEWRGMAARSWGAAWVAERAAGLLRDHRTELDALGEVVDRRARAGVEADWEVRILQEARARAATRLAAAEEVRSVRLAHLSGLVGACVRPDIRVGMPVVPTLADPEGPARPLDPSLDPRVRHLRELAAAREAQARVAADADRWSLAVVGGVGPTRSRAFDPGPVEYEYLAGISGRLRLDLGGVQRMNRRAGEAEAQALRADAESLELTLARELAVVDAELERMGARGEALLEEAERADRSLEAARLRWEAGVDAWSQVMQALERRLDAATALMVWEGEVLDAWIRRGELDGTLDEQVNRMEGEP